MTRSTSIHLATSMATLCLIVTAMPATAQISPANQIIGCQSKESDSERLECFDKVAARLNTVPEKLTTQAFTPIILKAQPIAPKATVMSPTPDVSGAIEDFGKDLSAGPKPKEAALLTPKGDVVFAVKHVQVFDFVKKRFYMTNGQVWEQTTGANLDIDEGMPPAGTTAEISKSGFGGYKLKINDKKWGVKVKRVR